jgi:DNA polymerase-4
VTRAIIHVDLDAFYASVEQLRRPELRGRPVIVGGAGSVDGRPSVSRSVVSAASYEARTHGVHSAMPLARAMRLCPDAAVLPVDFPAYRKASAQVFAIVSQYTPTVEPLSLDEAFLDVTDSERRFGSAETIAAEIRDRVWAECELRASFGVATCKTVAKIASDLRKPQGFVVVPPGEEAAFLAPLALRRLPGMGPATEKAIEGLGVSTLGELAALPLDVVQRRVGKAHGTSLWERSRGADDTPVTVPGRPRSVSREETFARDITQAGALYERIAELSADVAARLRRGAWVGRTVTIKLRYANFTTLSRQLTLPSPTYADIVIRDVARELFDVAWSGSPVRLVGVGVTMLEDAAQLDLFAQPKSSRLDITLDSLRDRFGPAAIQRGSGAGLRDLDWRSEDVRALGEQPAKERRGGHGGHTAGRDTR